MEAWRLYFEEFQARGHTADAQRFGREDHLAEAAHDAYRATADRLTREHGWSDERTLVITRGLNAAVRQWLDQGDGDWDVLRFELQRREAEMAASGGRDDRGAVQR
jgi:hypothetical protein